ncbi:MAG: glycoside hydrolase family 15 protein [Proteobacteria bacterium]|nr:glycoside hydrolase family 15 protein [Pseudomonadota bacterium]
MTPTLELGVIGNCQVAALVDKEAAIVWCCLPRPDGDPVFSALLTAEGSAARHGAFRIELAHQRQTRQCYVPNTAVLETTLTDESGNAVRITDFCPRFRRRGRTFRPMSLVRIVEPISGRPQITLRLRPTARYGDGIRAHALGSNHLTFTSTAVDYRVTTNASITAILEERAFVVDRALTFVLGPDETLEQSPAVLTRELLTETIDYWRDWVRTLAIPFDWQEAVIRAAITLKLCTFEDTGAVMAALTTSIPEARDTQRNWDYRYCWLRDSYFVIQALNRLGATRTMEAYLHFIDNIASSAEVRELQPLYGISGDPKAEERVVPALAGYRGMGPVRVGNSAVSQRQNDVYGSVILASTQLFFDARLARAGDAGLFHRLERLGERAQAVCELPDAGPWELRGSEHVHTFSAAISWAGCDRLHRIAMRIGDSRAAVRWQATAHRLQQRILAGAWNERLGFLASTFGGSDIDATALLLPELGLLQPQDPRFLATLDAVQRDLREGDLVYRYRHADDFGRPSTSFAICSFWMVNALAAVGRHDEAREQFERLLARRTSLGLLSEDIDAASGELWGNFPQTYSMVGIINSAVRLSRRWEDSL